MKLRAKVAICSVNVQMNTIIKPFVKIKFNFFLIVSRLPSWYRIISLAADANV